MKESFNPSSEDYKKFEDLPEVQKHNFKKVEGGFVSKEALSESEARERSVKIREKLERDTSGWFNQYNIRHGVEKEAESYEEAELRVDLETIKETLKNSPELGEEEKNELYDREKLLFEAVQHVRYLNRLDAEPKDEGVFWSEMNRILKTGSYELFPKNMRGDFLEKYGKFAVLHGDHTIKFRMLDAYKRLGISDSLIEIFKEYSVAQGEYDLYAKLLKNTDRQADQNELTRLGEQALLKKSPHDAIRAFKDSERNDLIKKAESLDIEQTLTAERKNEKLPNGLTTKGWMSHSTQYTFLEDILLKDGILSNTEVIKQHGKLNKYALRNHLQQFWTAYNYISVLDPWYGYSHYGSSKEATNYYEKMRSDYTDMMMGIFYDDNDRIRPEIADIVDHEATENYTLKVEASADARYKQIFKQLESFFEERAETTESSAKTERTENIELSRNFSAWGGGKPNLIIDPSRERFTTYGSCFGPESFVKAKISPDEIVGLVIPKEAQDDEYAFNWLLKLAKQSGIPLYISEDPEKYREGQIGIEQIWPKKMVISESGRTLS